LDGENKEFKKPVSESYGITNKCADGEYILFADYDKIYLSTLLKELDNVFKKHKKYLTQLRTSETEKYAHVTYFFDGLKEKPFPGEYWVIIPSIKTLHIEDYPELRTPEITTRLFQAFDENIYDFILVNYASPDLIGHTGNMKSGIECTKNY